MRPKTAGERMEEQMIEKEKEKDVLFKKIYIVLILLSAIALSTFQKFPFFTFFSVVKHSYKSPFPSITD